MKINSLLFSIIVSIFITSCSPSVSQPINLTPQPVIADTIQPVIADPKEETPTTTASQAVDDDWANVKSKGILKIGTTADYSPFSFYTETNQLDGFDIALAKEVAKRLGVDTEVNDLAFEGLTASLMAKQVDVVFAALSLTPKRLQVIDFTSVYYTGSDGILANKDYTNTNNITSPDQMVNQYIAVQSGSVYDEWVNDNLVQTGKIPLTSLFTFDSTKNAIEALKENRVDLVMTDLEAANTAMADGTVKLVGYGLYNQSFAAGLRKGSTLTGKINSVLQEIAADGTMNKLTLQYIGVKIAAAIPTRTPTSTPKLEKCFDAMQFVKDISYDDQDMIKPPILKPGEAFRKGWLIRNIGTCTWNGSYYLAFSQGNVDASKMEGQPISIPGIVAPGKEVEINVDLKAPQESGIYQGFWNLFTSQASPFGSTIWVGIQIKGKETPAPPGAPIIVIFKFDPNKINTNQCSTVSWQVKGKTTVVRLYDQRKKLVWDKAPTSGSYEVCHAQAGNINFTLETKGPGGVETGLANLKIKQPKPALPVIHEFQADPVEVALPECTFLQWNVSNATDISLLKNGVEIESNQPAAGSYQFCAEDPNEYYFDLIARDMSGNEERSSLMVTVNFPIPEPR